MLKKESNIYTQTGANSQQIGTQNNYYSISNPSVKIELKEPYKIYIFELLKNEQIKDILFTAFLPLIIFNVLISISIENLNLFKFLQVLLSFY
ncbi:hypothetical protein, partial [Aliarcobacter butzleri]|uniref:hypothetical protein n=1 Tax=Aliarcobacter butzleri TaxID=28197 RepID=UPI00125F524C